MTTGVDAGSSGWRTFPDFKERIIDHAQTRVLAFLNTVGRGMVGREETLEQDTSDMDPLVTSALARKYPNLIVGMKTAITSSAPDWTAVDRAVEAGRKANIPVMVRFGKFPPERPYQQLVLEHLRPGDISTHMYISLAPLLDPRGRLLPYLNEARKRGVKFDLGHGSGSFLWSQAAPAIRQGWVPDSISTDLHSKSMNSGMNDIATTMSKVLNLGVSLPDVIRMSTSNPAEEIKHTELGQLTPGAVADVAVLRLEKGTFGFRDSSGLRYPGTQKLICEMTLRDGRVVWDLNARSATEYHGTRHDTASGR